MSPKEQYEQLVRGTAKVLGEKELLDKLEKQMKVSSLIFAVFLSELS